MRLKHTRSGARTLAALALGTILCSGPLAPSFAANDPALALQTTTPIKHLIVIFQENSSFDHYFATYPNATNADGTPFTPVAGTPTVNGLNNDLLHQNPNLQNGFINPFRFLQKQAVTNSQNHNYGSEQQAYNNGLMNNFVKVGSGNTNCPAPAPAGCQNVGYFDGNTVTALWNYAQNFAMSDNHFGTTFGPSTPGALNLISGQTHGSLRVTRTPATGVVTLQNPQANSGQSFFVDSDGLGTQTGDIDPGFDDCGNAGTNAAVVMANSGTTPQTNIVSPAGPTGGTPFPFKSINIGNLLSAQHITWGWFQGGFRPSVAAVPGTSAAVCGVQANKHVQADQLSGAPADPTQTAYNSHHEPFLYYASTSNPHHLAPTSTAAIGTDADQANHNYDLIDFKAALAAHNLPAVTYLKATNEGDGHPGNSDPLSEQTFLVDIINLIMQSPEWSSTAIVIEWDDSDGWYDHAVGPIVNPSNAAGFDAIAGGTPTGSTLNGTCGTPAAGAFNGRCGYGPRFPFLVISPWAKQNYVDHTTTDQASILKFIEDNWLCKSAGPNNTCTLATHIDDTTGITNPAQMSFDVKAGSLLGHFDFTHQKIRRMTLDDMTGAVLVP